jgi:putative Mg2+ transporter-C (MgtC) family protein
MEGMPLHLDWAEVALRLALTVVAGGLIGINRNEHSRPAGLRTTLLVCLAASAAMIQANLLLPTRARPPDSFIMMDLMRLPLGILSGIGFIGAGAILRRGDIVTGVTTAATLWFVTVMGLCIGGGQIGLGMTLLVLGLVILSLLKKVEQHIPQQLRGSLILLIDDTGPAEDEVRAMLDSAGLKMVSLSLDYATASRHLRLSCDVRWQGRPDDNRTPLILNQFSQRPGILKVRWKVSSHH